MVEKYGQFIAEVSFLTYDLSIIRTDELKRHPTSRSQCERCLKKNVFTIYFRSNYLGEKYKNYFLVFLNNIQKNHD